MNVSARNVLIQIVTEAGVNGDTDTSHHSILSVQYVRVGFRIDADKQTGDVSQNVSKQ